MGHNPQNDLIMPGQRQRGFSSDEEWIRAIQHAHTGVLERGYTSFEVGSTYLRLVENEYSRTTAIGHRRMRSRLYAGTGLREMAGYRELPGIESGQFLLGLPEVEEGSRLAPMHRFHDPAVPWLPLCRSGRG